MGYWYKSDPDEISSCVMCHVLKVELAHFRGGWEKKKKKEGLHIWRRERVVRAEPQWPRRTWERRARTRRGLLVSEKRGQAAVTEKGSVTISPENDSVNYLLLLRLKTAPKHEWWKQQAEVCVHLQDAHQPAQDIIRAEERASCGQHHDLGHMFRLR